MHFENIHDKILALPSSFSSLQPVNPVMRPWWGHDDHIHVRLHCPEGEACAEQEPPPEGDGCGDEIESWLTKTSKNILDNAESKPLLLDDMPKECIQVLQAPDKK